MIYQNLFETWEKLASDECYLTEIEVPTYSFGDELCYQIGWTDLHLIWMTQGYIQRCIEDRGWQLFLTNAASYSSIEIQVNSTRYKAGGLKADTTIPRNLLTAYLMALAAQRSPSPGAWQHFKSGTVFVKTTAKWSGDTRNPDSFTQNYQVEESPEIKLQPRLLLGSEDRWVYDGPKDYGDRVFYSDISGRWARETSVFLSLVGRNQEHEGKLRFTEVSNAKA